MPTPPEKQWNHRVDRVTRSITRAIQSLNAIEPLAPDVLKLCEVLVASLRAIRRLPATSAPLSDTERHADHGGAILTGDLSLLDLTTQVAGTCAT
jgi:hypothetical protein